MNANQEFDKWWNAWIIRWSGPTKDRIEPGKEIMRCAYISGFDRARHNVVVRAGGKHAHIK